MSTLVEQARAGSTAAWDELVARYAPLVTAVVHRYRLQASDVQDVAQTVWLRLVEHLDDIRNPQALPGWIATTVRNECLRVVRSTRRTQAFDPLLPSDDGPPFRLDLADEAVQVDDCVVNLMTDADRRASLRLAFAELPDTQRRLLVLLMADPPLTYAEVSERARMPIGSIGPLRGRALERIRRHPVVKAHMEAGERSRA